jgi:selenocysteine lyase/cysteine desulfurase
VVLVFRLPPTEGHCRYGLASARSAGGPLQLGGPGGGPWHVFSRRISSPYSFLPKKKQMLMRRTLGRAFSSSQQRALVKRLRDDTPGTTNVLHFNNAGAALLPECVSAAVSEHLELEASIGGYEAAAEMEAQHEEVYSSIARLIHCNAKEIALVDSATMAWQKAFYGAATTFAEGDVVLTSQVEYAANFVAFLQMKKQRGVQVEVIPSLACGTVDVQALRKMVDVEGSRVKLIAVTHIPTNGALVNPAAAIGQIAREHGILYLLDACQSVGQVSASIDPVPYIY